MDRSCAELPQVIPHIEVACGVLRDASGKVLIVQRPAGKIAAGKWEFPGGKIEPGETPAAALWRELAEEIGIRPGVARPLIRFVHAYFDRVVTLDTWLVTAWDGELRACEGQRLVWRALDDTADLDILPTVPPILKSLTLPEDYVFTPPDADPPDIIAGLDGLPEKALLRLRLPGLPDRSYESVARAVIAQAQPRGLRVVLDRDRSMAQRLGAQGWHRTQQQLDELSATSSQVREANTDRMLRIASCHDAGSIRMARAVGMDAVVLGPVMPTATHPDGRQLGWVSFAEMMEPVGMPVYAIGGLAPADKATAFAHRAQGVAGISAYWRRSGS
ncbi:MAG: Nudix family hydrolase [Panacagrimonas sp.]